jgi:hypothetical protein
MNIFQRINCGKQSRTVRRGRSSWMRAVENSYSTSYDTGMVQGRLPNRPYMALLGKSVYLTHIYILSDTGVIV